MSDLRAELALSVDQSEWDWLKQHVQRDVVVVVALCLDLIDVGVAIANDNVTSIQHWIGEQLIAKPSVAQMAVWNSDRAIRFNALIVQPYVLVQKISA